jgi:hypothetical protein
MDAQLYLAISFITLFGLIASIAGRESRDGFEQSHLHDAD